MTNFSKLFATATLALGGLTLTTASAQNPGFELGDLVIGFQASGGVGSGSYLLARLGQAGTLRDETGNVSLINLGTELTSLFGASWFDRSDVFVGVFGILSNDEFNGALVNGDPDVTPYVGIPRQFLGTPGSAGSFAPFFNAAGTQSAANGMFAAANIFETAGTGSVSTISKTLSLVDYDDQNPISAGIQGNAYDGIFSGGVQAPFGAGIFGSFGGVNAEAALDLYRIQLFNNIPGQYGFGGAVNEGEYNGTIVINNAGAVSLVNVPEPSTAGFLAMGAALVGMVRRRRAVKA